MWEWYTVSGWVWQLVASCLVFIGTVAGSPVTDDTWEVFWWSAFGFFAWPIAAFCAVPWAVVETIRSISYWLQAKYLLSKEVKGTSIIKKKIL